MSQFHLLPAGAPELVRTNQKDRFYIDRITSLLSNITRQLLPLRMWLKWQTELHLLTELGYYGLTTLLDNQTLGEEYTNTIQVKSQTGSSSRPLYSPASFVQRTLAILLQTVGPYIIERALEVVYKRLHDRNIEYLDLTEQQYQSLERVVEFLEELVSIFNRLHLAWFYLRGIFYHFGKRFSSIQYVMVRYKNSLPTDLNTSLSTYRFLGWIILFQVSIKLLKWLWNCLNLKGGRSTHSRSQIEHEQREGASFSSGLKCPLCLEACRWQTVTLCGHVFCWECVCEWVGENSECPVCRCSVEPQQLVCLQHFDC